MKIGLLGDIHGNGVALNAVLEDASLNKVDMFMILGDIIGYGPHQQECIDWVRDQQIPAIVGNHELLLRNGQRMGKPHVDMPLDFAARILTNGYVDMLQRLPIRAFFPQFGFGIVHGKPHEGSETLGYLISREQAVASSIPEMERKNEFVYFNAHTHLQYFWEFQHPTYAPQDVPSSGGRVSDTSTRKIALPEGIDQLGVSCAGKTFTINPSLLYIINVGSVGQPRDGDSRAGYVIFDTDAGTVTFRRVEYDIDETRAHIISMGFPPELAWRLDGNKLVIHDKHEPYRMYKSPDFQRDFAERMRKKGVEYVPVISTHTSASQPSH